MRDPTPRELYVMQATALALALIGALLWASDLIWPEATR